MRSITSFLKKSDGLTTIEWVVLCAVVLFGALAVSQSILGGAGTLGTSVTNKMTCAADDSNCS